MLDINAVERVLDKRAHRGASDESLIKWLESLKRGVWRNQTIIINGFIDAIKQTSSAHKH